MSDKDKTTTCRADEIVLGPPLHLNYACDVVVVTQEQIDRRKAEDAAAERIAAWLEAHGDDDEFTGEESEVVPCYFVEKLAAAIREGRWRK